MQSLLNSKGIFTEVGKVTIVLFVLLFGPTSWHMCPLEWTGSASLNHWTSREVPKIYINFKILIKVSQSKKKKNPENGQLCRHYKA